MIIDQKQIGTRIKKRRELLGWSRIDLAEKAGIAERTVAYIERGDRSASWMTIQYCLVALGLRIRCCIAKFQKTGAELSP